MIYYNRLPKFEYFAPNTLEEALTLLKDYRGKVKIIAGGTDLLLSMRDRGVTPKYLIGLKNIGGMDYIHYSETEGLRIGALTTIVSIESSQLIKQKYSILNQTAKCMASCQIRNVATIGGNICSAVPSADTAPPLIVLNAKLKLRSSEGTRLVKIEEFFTGPCQTVLQETELLIEIIVPEITSDHKGIYIKRGLRQAMSLATVSVAVITILEGEYFKDIRIALGAVAPTPIRAKNAEILLRGKIISNDLLKKASNAASNEACPISDFRASEEHRRELIRALTLRAIEQSLDC